MKYLPILLLLATPIRADPGACCQVVARDAVNPNQTSMGTGFAVAHTDDGDLVLTNHHVIEGATSLYCQFPEGRYTAKLVKIISPRNKGDVVLLRCRARKNRTIFVIRERPIRVGERLRWFGFPRGQPQLAEGRGQVLGTKYASGVIQVHGRASIEGESGSPLVDSTGAAVGIVWGGGGGFGASAGGTPFSVVKLKQCIGQVCQPRYRWVEVVPEVPDLPEDPKPDPPDPPPKPDPYVLTEEDIDRIIAKMPPIVVFFHTDDSWKAIGADGTKQIVRLSDKPPSIHVPPVTLEMYLEATKGAKPELVDVISERLGESLKLLNGIE